MSDSDRELSSIDKLVEIEDNTNDDGTVMVTIDEWEEVEGNSVRVDFVTPTGDLESEQMQFPQPGGDLSRYKFYRLVDNAGLAMRNAELLEGEVVRAQRSPRDGWSLNAPERKDTSTRARERATAALKWARSVDWHANIITAVWILFIIALFVATVGAL